MTVWTLTTLLAHKMVGPGGVFSTREKAEEAAKREREEISTASDNPSVWIQWEMLETTRGCVWSNGMWDVIIRSWEVDNPNA